MPNARLPQPDQSRLQGVIEAMGANSSSGTPNSQPDRGLAAGIRRVALRVRALHDPLPTAPLRARPHGH
eukprot:3668331-Alexandrium_andersonii.AAC.1